MAPQDHRAAPDIVVVVLDSVRFSDFPGGPSGRSGLPTFDRLRRESIEYTASVAPSSWTVPSHASLLTGLPVEDHRVHSRGETRLRADAPTLPLRLRGLGYRSACLSANPLVGPGTGLSDAFDAAIAAGWHESYLRGRSLRRSLLDPAPPGSRLTGLASRSFADPVAAAIQRWPGPFDTMVRWWQQRAGADPIGGIAGWIEPAFAAWLRTVPADVPTFSLLNFMDAHEPYIGIPAENGHPRLRPGRQDRSAWVRGGWRPTAAQLAGIHGLYRSSFAVLDRRVAQVIDVLESAGRWNRTWLVLTSDHGQAFGERGFLYHGIRLYEPVVRVPLLIRPPTLDGGPQQRAGWTSLTEVAPMLWGAATGSVPSRDRPAQPRPVTAVSDGVVGPLRRRLRPARLADLDRLLVAAYDGDRKVTVDPATGEGEAVDLGDDPNEQRPTRVDPRDTTDPLVVAAGAVWRKAFGAPGPEPAGLADRLRSWGYA